MSGSGTALSGRKGRFDHGRRAAERRCRGGVGALGGGVRAMACRPTRAGGAKPATGDDRPCSRESAIAMTFTRGRHGRGIRCHINSASSMPENSSGARGDKPAPLTEAVVTQASTTRERRARELINLIGLAIHCANLPDADEPARREWLVEARRAWDELRDLLPGDSLWEASPGARLDRSPIRCRGFRKVERATNGPET